MSTSIDSNRYLNLTLISDFERFGLLTMIIAAVVLVLVPVLSSLETRFAWVFITSLIGIDLFLWLLGLSLNSENTRRTSFIWYIERELLRRKGVSPGQTMTPIKAD